MNTNYEKVGTNKAKLTFEFTGEEFAKGVEKAFLENRGKITVPGFRRGKAPRKVIENMFGKNVFYEDAVDLLVADAYIKALDEYKLNPVDRPRLQDMPTVEDGAPVFITLEVSVEPDVKLGEYKGLKVARNLTKVTDEDVDARIEQERNKVARSVEVEGRALEDGDIATLDYAGTVDGVAFAGGTAEDQTLEIGSGHFIPGFEEQMIGMNIDEERDLHVTFPTEYHAKELAGKEAVFHVKLKGISKEELPALDDDFASEVSEFDTLAEFRADLAKKMQAENDAKAENELVNDLMEDLLDKVEIDVPDAMIETRLDEMMEELGWNMRRSGITLEQYAGYMGKDMKGLRDMYRKSATDRVRYELTMAAIAKAENLEVSDAELDEELSIYAENMHETLEHLKSTISETASNRIRKDLAIRKAAKLVRDSAIVEDDGDKPEEPAEAKPEE